MNSNDEKLRLSEPILSGYGHEDAGSAGEGSTGCVARPAVLHATDNRPSRALMPSGSNLG